MAKKKRTKKNNRRNNKGTEKKSLANNMTQKQIAKYLEKEGFTKEEAAETAKMGVSALQNNGVDLNPKSLLKQAKGLIGEFANAGRDEDDQVDVEKDVKFNPLTGRFEWKSKKSE